MAGEQMTLGEFVKSLTALLSENDTSMLFKDEAPWHFLLHRLQEEPFDGKPQFLNRLIFDWGGPFPKCKNLSRYLQFLHVSGCVGTTNPSYEKMVLNPALQELWYSQVQQMSEAQRKFLEHAAALAHEEFAAAQ
jgi:hypothetical protein